MGDKKCTTLDITDAQLSFVKDVTATAAELNILDGATATAAELNILDGATVTAAELNRAADKSASVVTANGDTLTVTEAAHGDRYIVFGKASGTVVTLPAATGTGNKYTFIVSVAATSNANIIKVANATDVFNGSKAYGVDDDGEGATGYQWMAETGDDTLTMDGTATGGKVGDKIEVLDYAAGFFSVTANLIQSGGSEATPFSASVA